jgi:hypothetical protein
MNRLGFLKLAAASSLAVIVSHWKKRIPLSIPGDGLSGDFVSGPGGRLFRGTRDGRILASRDGAAWSRTADFGEECRVQELVAAGGSLAVRIGYHGFTFRLVSADGVAWRTV